MINKKIIILLILFSIIPLSNAEIFTITDNVIENIDNDYKIVLNEDVKELIYDDNNTYFNTENFVYINNKTNGSKKFKIMILNSSQLNQDNNFLYLKSENKLYKINKISGSIDNIKQYSYLDGIYSFFGSTSSTGSLITSDNSKVNKSGDNMEGNYSDIRFNMVGHSYFPHTVNPTKKIIGGFGFVDMAVWGVTLLNLYNGVNFNTSCGTNDGYGGAIGYCWEPINVTPRRAGMAFQFVNDGFNHFIWDANIDITKYNIENQTNHTQGYYTASSLSKDWSLNFGNLTIKRLNGTGNDYACFDSTGKLFRQNTAC